MEISLLGFMTVTANRHNSRQQYFHFHNYTLCSETGNFTTPKFFSLKMSQKDFHMAPCISQPKRLLSSIGLKFCWFWPFYNVQHTLVQLASKVHMATLSNLQQPPRTKTGHVQPLICLWSAFEGSRAALALVWTLLSGLTPLGIAGLQNLYNKPPFLTFSSLLGPKLAMCNLQSVSDQLLKAVELPWRWFGPF